MDDPISENQPLEESLLDEGYFPGDIESDTKSLASSPQSVSDEKSISSDFDPSEADPSIKRASRIRNNSFLKEYERTDAVACAVGGPK